MNLQSLLRFAALSLMVVATQASAQSESQLKERLIGQPLYLRGFWQGYSLSFDAAGKPTKPTTPGPLTLAGIDIRSVSISGKRLTLSGNRVALVADADGVLQRKTPMSYTRIAESLLPKDKRVFKSTQDIKITIDADQAGNFDPALAVVFANGLPDLATAAPPYWSCYAAGFFQPSVIPEQARKLVDACVARKDLSEVKTGDNIDGTYTPPRITQTEPPVFPHEASELGVRGITQLHCTVTRKGICVGFQVVRVIGAGIEEAMLTYLYQAHFEPAMKDGFPVNGSYDAKYTLRDQ